MTDHFVATKLVFPGKKYINDEITNDNSSQQHLKIHLVLVETFSFSL